MQSKIFRLGITLSIFCIVSAGLLAFVYVYTKPVIELQEKLAFENSLREVLPSAKSFKESKVEDQITYQGMKGQEIIGFAVSASPQGYSGKIKMLVGIDIKGKIQGVKVLDQRETAGLGAGVAETSFLKQFLEKTIKDPIEAKKDIKAISGATISSRAVCQGVRKALELYAKVHLKKGRK